MRIVAGRHRGRRLEAPEGLVVRPTADRAREAIFDILTSGHLACPGRDETRSEPLAGVDVLEVFAGTGALGLEALSRGAVHTTFLENQAAALAVLRRNLRALGEEANATVIQGDALRPPRATKPHGLIFLDPPYGQGLASPALRALHAAGWLAAGALAVIELMARESFEPPESFEPIDERRYGKARVVFLRAPG